jgi:hypothetical protein
MAVFARQEHLGDQLVHHSDRGVQGGFNRSSKQRPFPPCRLCCPAGPTGTTAASDSLPTPRPFPDSTPVIERRLPRQPAARSGRGGPLQFPPPPSERSAPSYAGESLAAAFQDLYRFHGLRREPPGSALSSVSNDAAGFASATDRSVAPPQGLSTLGSSPARFQAEPPACYRAPWRLPGPDSHRQATTSFRSGHDRWTITSMISGRTGCPTRPHDAQSAEPGYLDSGTLTTRLRSLCRDRLRIAAGAKWGTRVGVNTGGRRRRDCRHRS